MAIQFGARIKSAWNAFRNRNPTDYTYTGAMGYGYRPDRHILSLGNERSIAASVYNRIAMDVAAIQIVHMRVNENRQYVETIESGLNNCFSVNANADQTGREFVKDIVLSLFDEGVVAIVPTDANKDPETGAFDPLELRVGKITNWYPYDVEIELYNEHTGMRERLKFSKSSVAIVENPFYPIMNQPNSTYKRLVAKLNILDSIDRQSGSGKLDVFVQVPYSVRSESRKKYADKRKEEMERQLEDSKHGIVYIDGTERITQLNRPVENNLMNQIEYLTNMFYNQLGITQEVMNGTADEAVMLNYYNTAIEPVLSAITDAMKWKFLTKTARTQLQTIGFVRNPFRLVPVNEIAEIADKFTRNEIMTSNELRAIIGYHPVDDPRADELRNKNLNASDDQLPMKVNENDIADTKTHQE